MGEEERFNMGDLVEMDHEKLFFINNKKSSFSSEQKPTFKPNFIKKFISYIRRKPISPTNITTAAQKRIISFYTELRKNHNDESDLPITARTLETIIRLASANAKLCLENKNITDDDVALGEMVLRSTLLCEKWNPLIEKKKDYKWSKISPAKQIKDGEIQQQFFKKHFSGKNLIKIEKKHINGVNQSTVLHEEVTETMSKILNSIGNMKQGVIRYHDFREAVYQSKCKVTDISLRAYLQLQIDEQRL